MQAYPAYRELDLEFLNAIPAHWDIAKLKYLSSVNFSNVDKHTYEEEIPVLLCNYVDVYKNDFITPDMDFMKVSATEIEIKKFILRRGDVLITKDSESWEDIAVPAYVTTDMDGVLCGYHLAQIRSTGIDGKFLFWALCSGTLNDQYKVEAHGITRYGLGKDSIENSFIPVPSLPEQQAIADFLDCKTAQIDALIEKKQRQIDLLQEQRIALINQAVTKGLNPNAPMKDSGVEWLAEIPNHWTMTTVRYYYDVKLGKMFDSNKQIETDFIKPYLRAANIHWNEILLDEVGVNEMSFSESQLERYSLKPGDLLITEGGVTVGRSAIWNGELAECYYQNSLNRARPLKDITTKWLYYWMYFVTNNGFIDIGADKSTFGHLTNEKLKALPIPIPPVSEHNEIIAKLESFEPKMEAQVALIEKQIAYLQEYRTALISEAVTGKIDVR